MTSEPTIVVTGYGPFGPHSRNTSWQAVKIVKERLWDNARVKLVVQEIPVDYEFVQQNVPRIWTGSDEAGGEGNAVLALIHVGVSGIASKITIETQAHNSGYFRKDVNGKCPDEGRCVSECGGSGDEELLQTILDVQELVDCVNRCKDSGLDAVEAELSTNAGRYLCEYVLYKSLKTFKDRRALFIHVPDATTKEKCDYTEEQCAAAIKVILDDMLRQLGERDGKSYL